MPVRLNSLTRSRRLKIATSTLSSLTILLLSPLLYLSPPSSLLTKFQPNYSITSAQHCRFHSLAHNTTALSSTISLPSIKFQPSSILTQCRPNIALSTLSLNLNTTALPSTLSLSPPSVLLTKFQPNPITSSAQHCHFLSFSHYTTALPSTISLPSIKFQPSSIQTQRRPNIAATTLSLSLNTTALPSTSISQGLGFLSLNTTALPSTISHPSILLAHEIPTKLDHVGSTLPLHSLPHNTTALPSTFISLPSINFQPSLILTRCRPNIAATTLSLCLLPSTLSLPSILPAHEIPTKLNHFLYSTLPLPLSSTNTTALPSPFISLHSIKCQPSLIQT